VAGVQQQKAMLSATGGLVAVFDIETSHPNKEAARVIEIAYQVLDPARNLESVAQFDSLVYHEESDFAIDPASAKIHGITAEECFLKGRSFAEVLDRLTMDWRDVTTLVSHGVDVDVSILGMECIRLAGVWPFQDRLLVCTKEIGAVVCRIPRGRSGYKWPTLLELWTHLCCDGGVAVADHRAAQDVKLCVDCCRVLFPS
jgi:DNA polymerase III epsilon subunit-like protein